MTTAGYGRMLTASAVGLGVVAVALGALTLVTTSGVSMQPTYHAGDLVVVMPAERYTTGQIVAYRDHQHDLNVLHRVVSVDATGYTLRGDNNASIDAVRPTQDDVIGRAVLHIPRVGGWLRDLAHPIPVTVLVVILLTGVGTAASRRRRRHRMSRHAAPHGPPAAVWGLSPRLRIAIAATAAVGALGVALAVVSWTTSAAAPATIAAPAQQSMSFSYEAQVGRTPAYDDTTARSPDPVFRRLVETVDVHFVYEGQPGRIDVTAELSTASGWHSVVPVAAPVTFTGSSYQGLARLDLLELERHAHAAAAVTGVPASLVTVAVRTAVTHRSTTGFAPALLLSLSPLQLALADAGSLRAEHGKPPVVHPPPRTPAVLGASMSIATGRKLAPALLLSAAAAGLLLLLLARRTSPVTEAAALRTRYASLLLTVHPMPVAAGQPVIDVTRFADLARLATRYGLLILHWTRSDVTTFTVQDQDRTYRYRTGATVPLASPVTSTTVAPGLVTHDGDSVPG